MHLVRTLLAVGAVAATLVACGGDDSDTAVTSGNGVDLAFVNAMVPHHESAVAMAEIAQKQAKTAFVKDLASDIISTQRQEIATMQGLEAELVKAGVREADLGVPEHMMGMDADMAALEHARPFDRAFIDEMVSHHQGAIVMARAELAKGKNGELRELAQAIIDAQAREIEAMNEARKKQYGSASPAAGVPSVEDDEAHESDEHSG